MKKILITAALAVLVIGGCKKEEITDEEAIMNIVDESPFFKTSEHYEGQAVSDSGDTSHTAKGDSITPILWGREMHESPDPDIEIDIHGDSAHLRYIGYNRGYLDILTWMSDTGWILIKKPLSETFEIRAIFRRTGSETDENRGWELTHITGVLGVSDSINTVRIDSVRIQSESYPDTVLRDPLGYFDVDSILTFSPGEDVYLTMYTNDSTARAFLHVFAVFPRHIRLPFANLGGGLYGNQNAWHVQLIPAPRLAVFDLMQYETLHDTDYPYDFCGWLFPYQVK